MKFQFHLAGAFSFWFNVVIVKGGATLEFNAEPRIIYHTVEVACCGGHCNERLEGRIAARKDIVEQTHASRKSAAPHAKYCLGVYLIREP